MKPWIRQLLETLLKHESCIVVTLVGVQGSAPQSNGAKLIVCRAGQWGTIGGGNLEYQAANEAWDLLEQGREQFSAPTIRPVNLGDSSGQYCGGAATLVYQRYHSYDLNLSAQLAQRNCLQGHYLLTSLSNSSTPPWRVDEATLRGQHFYLDNAGNLETFIADPESAATIVEDQQHRWLLEKLYEDIAPLLLFGAGHVGSAVAQALAPLPFAVRWIDSRENIFADPHPDKVYIVKNANPLYEVNHALQGAWYLVMTHDHGLDLEIVRAVLEREDFTYLGLIGSSTKLMSFQHRLREWGFSQRTIDRINCPIGIDGINSKQPTIIAASVAARLLQLREMQSKRAA